MELERLVDELAEESNGYYTDIYREASNCLQNKMSKYKVYDWEL